MVNKCEKIINQKTNTETDITIDYKVKFNDKTKFMWDSLLNLVIYFAEKIYVKNLAVVETSVQNVTTLKSETVINDECKDCKKCLYRKCRFNNWNNVCRKIWI